MSDVGCEVGRGLLMQVNQELLPPLEAHPLGNISLRYPHVYLLAFLGKVYVKQTFLVFLCVPVFFAHGDIGTDAIKKV